MIERDVHRVAAALLKSPGSRDVHEHPAHLSRRHRQEVLAVLPLHALRVDQPEIGLVDERRGLQAVPGALAGQAVTRDAMELGVHGLHELLERSAVAAAPCLEQLGDVDGTLGAPGGRHGSGNCSEEMRRVREIARLSTSQGLVNLGLRAVLQFASRRCSSTRLPASSSSVS